MVLFFRGGQVCLAPLFAFLCACNAVQQSSDSIPVDQLDVVELDQGSGVISELSSEVGSMLSSSPLSSLAEDLDRVAIERSVHFQSFRAALAERRALEFERYPRVVPAASAPIGGGEPSLGINVEQTLWDGGRVRTRLDNSDLSVTEAKVMAWQERNQTVFDGLASYIETRRFTSRIELLTRLQQDLGGLDEILRTRVEGGVADRGEPLRMSLSLQEVQRDMVSDQSELRAAEAELIRLVPISDWPRSGLSLSDTSALCSREWSSSQPPDVAVAELGLMRAENNYELVRARRFPSLVLGAGSSYSDGEFSAPTATLRLDASDMLGLGRRGSIESAEASRTGARRAYVLQQEATDADLERLEQEYLGHVSDVAQLERLQRTNRENLDLYREQVIAGSIPVAEGISLFRESTNTELDLIDARARIVRNCLESARLRGTLAPLSVSNE